MLKTVLFFRNAEKLNWLVSKIVISLERGKTNYYSIVVFMVLPTLDILGHLDFNKRFDFLFWSVSWISKLAGKYISVNLVIVLAMLSTPKSSLAYF